MKTRTIIVKAMDGSDLSSSADLLECEVCGFSHFIIYWIGKEHQHLQCLKCGTSYCDNQCKFMKGGNR